MRELIREALDGEAVIDVRHRAQPADADVRPGRPVFHAQVRDRIGHVGPALLEMAGITVDGVHVEDGRDGRKD